MSKYFTFSKGYFDQDLILYNFQDTNDIEVNYQNCLFQIIPKSEYLFQRKLQKITDKLKSIRLVKDLNEFDFNEQKDVYMKYKQEMKSNHENFRQLINSRKKIDSEDCVQLIHLATGKYVMFKEDPKSLKIYLALTEENSRRTNFRIKLGFNYQSENSTRVFSNTSICLICGDNPNGKQIYISYPVSNKKNEAYKIDLTGDSPLLNRNKATKLKVEDALDIEAIPELELEREETHQEKSTNTWLYMKYQRSVSKQRSIIERDSVKKSKESKGNYSLSTFADKHIICDEKNYNKWVLLKFSNNMHEDNKYLNNLDVFWIQNCEIAVYLVSIEDDSANKSDETQIYKNESKLSILATSSLSPSARFETHTSQTVHPTKAPDQSQGYPKIQQNVKMNPGLQNKIKNIIDNQTNVKNKVPTKVKLDLQTNDSYIGTKML